MPTITLTLDDTGDALRLVWDVARLQSAAAAAIHFDGRTNVDPELAAWFDGPSEPEADLTPPHGIERVTTTPTAADGADIRDMIRKSVGCPRCNASTAWPCHSRGGQNYPDFIHQARIDAWNRQP